MLFRTIGFVALAQGQMLHTVSPLERTVDLVSGFFKGYRKPELAKDIMNAYEVYEGTYKFT